jgi:hypothetical protein
VGGPSAWRLTLASAAGRTTAPAPVEHPAESSTHDSESSDLSSPRTVDSEDPFGGTEEELTIREPVDPLDVMKDALAVFVKPRPLRVTGTIEIS